MTPTPSPLSRAHRRYLGLTLPPSAVPGRGDFEPLQRVILDPALRRTFQERLTTAGQTRGGVLLGERYGGALHLRAALSGGYGVTDPLLPCGHYVLGAVEAAQHLSDRPTEWVGHWVMPADGLAPELGWTERVWHLARRRALVSPEHVLLTFGEGPERLVVAAYNEDDSAPHPLEIGWEQPGATP